MARNAKEERHRNLGNVTHQRVKTTPRLYQTLLSMSLNAVCAVKTLIISSTEAARPITVTGMFRALSFIIMFRPRPGQLQIGSIYYALETEKLQTLADYKYVRKDMRATFTYC